MTVEAAAADVRREHPERGRRIIRERGVWVSGDREQSFPSASLVNYIVRDPISVFTVH